jgi:competence protein ComEA
MTRPRSISRRFGLVFVFVSLAFAAHAAHAAPEATTPATRSTSAAKAAPAAKGDAKGDAKGARAAAPVADAKLEVELNGAAKEELMKLPGVSEAVATRIIAGRPYLSKAFLLTNKVVSEDVYLAIRNLVTVRPPGVGSVVAPVPKKR